MKNRKGLMNDLKPNKRMILALGLVLGLFPIPKLWAHAHVDESQIVAQAQKMVKGKVTDGTGEPLIGVNVAVVGQTGGTITDIDGNYSIGVPGGAKLKFSYIGYADQEVVVGNQSVLNVVLKESTEVLDEVVVVGFGTQKKETLTGAVTVVNDKILKSKGSLSSPLQAMQGQVPGVIITRNSSAPGDESWGMKVRGAVSANSAAPLIIIDGVAYEDVNAMRNLNPSDIQSINFLKDGSAAIYGARAAGGVVLITTKQAQEGKAKVEYSGSYTYKKVGLQPKLMSLSEWANAVVTARTNDGYDEGDTWIRYARMALANEGKYLDFDHTANPFGAFDDTADICFFDTNWTDILFGNTGSTQHDLAVSGGTDKNLYRLSAGYLYDGSNLMWGNNHNQRFNLRLTNRIQVTDRFRLESVIGYNRQDQVAPSQIGNTLTDGYPQPGLPAATIDGRPYSWGTWLSPIWYAELGGDSGLKVSEINISETLTFNLTKHLDLVGNLGYNTSTATRDKKQLAITSFNYTGTKSFSGSGKDIPKVANPEESYYMKSNSRTDFYSFTGYLNYHNTFAKHHNVKAMIGTQYELKEYDYNISYVKNIQPTLDVINGSGTIAIVSPDDKNKGAEKWQEAILAFYSRLNYDYKSKYLAEVNMRYDGSSKFKTDRWAFFWGVSGGWRISEEGFMRDIDWLNELKLRASYGQVGNQGGVNRYEGEQFYKYSPSIGVMLGSDKVTFIDTDGNIASHGRTWERIHNYNIGIDFGMFNNRLTGTAEAFMKKNNNMLITVTYPGILGDGAGMTNAGKFEAKGYEFQVNWADRIGEVNYHVGGTFTYATNELTDIGGVTVLKSGVQGKQQGYPLNSVFGLRHVGKIQNEEQRQKYLYRYLAGNNIGLTNEIRLGDNMYEDVNGDGKLTEEDLVYLGTDDPKISYSFNLGAEWKGFDISCVFQGVGKRTIFRSGSNRWRIPMEAVYQNSTNLSVGNTWSPENPNAFYPTYTNKGTVNKYNYQCSSWSVENGAYLRLKNVTLGYTVPASLLNKLKVLSTARIYVSGADLWEVSKINDGWDPEASYKVEKSGRYPFVRTITFGMNLTF